MIVLDASAALEMLLGAPLGTRITQRLFLDGESLHAPHLIDVEIAQVLRRLARRGEIDATRTEQVFQDLMDLPISRYPHLMLMPRIWALRKNATAYDATYLALAEALDAQLITCDAALATVPGQSRRVEVISS